jgi:hypothetical protein
MPHSRKQTNSKSPINKNSKNNIPPPSRSPSPQNDNIVSQQPSMIDSMKQGFSFGLGSSIAHSVVGSIFKSKDTNNTNNTNSHIDTTNSHIDTTNSHIDTNKPNVTTSKIYELYNKCVEENDININCNNILEINNKV